MSHQNAATPISEILHENNQYAVKNRTFFTWMPVNVILLSFILGDIWKHNRSNTVVIILEHTLACILSLNILYLCCHRFLSQYFRKQYSISFQQFNTLQSISNQVIETKCNLHVIPDQPNKTQTREKISFESFRVSSSPVFSSPNSPSLRAEFSNDSVKAERSTIKHFHVSPTSAFANTPIISDSHCDNSFHKSSSDSYFAFSGDYDFSSHSMASSNLSKSLTRGDIGDEVDKVKKSVDGTEYRQAHNLSAGATNINGYWKSKDTLYRSQNASRSDIILNGAYQLSPTAALESVKPVNEVSSLGANPTICKKFGIHPAYLNEWIANLRMWITQTILTRIINEIKDVNIALPLHGVTNISIGSSGIERLKKAAAMSHVSQSIPSLSSLISFLDVSPNQEYVVQRINALSTGSMSNYCWNAGGTYEGKPWNESLPTDAALVMHLIAAYFDSQIFPLPHTAPDGRQFSSTHYIRTPAVPARTEKSLVIYQQRISPPHFQLIIGENTYDISRGRNNLFHDLLFFLQHVKTKESGMFEHVNLGSSGINMLWIINEPSHNLYKKVLI